MDAPPGPWVPLKPPSGPLCPTPRLPGTLLAVEQKRPVEHSRWEERDREKMSRERAGQKERQGIRTQRNGGRERGRESWPEGRGRERGGTAGLGSSPRPPQHPQAPLPPSPAAHLNLLSVLKPFDVGVRVGQLHHQPDLVALAHLVGWLQLLLKG